MPTKRKNSHRPARPTGRKQTRRRLPQVHSPKALRRTAPDLVQAAEEADLRYVRDDKAGISRRRAGRGFTYQAPDGATVREKSTIARIHSLAIPPAWTNVWICPTANGHIQATGYDARGRKQYRYHPHWREARDKQKYDRMIRFACALPRIRRRVNRDLKRRGLSREKVLAAIVRLLESTLIRVGNDEYAKNNNSYGLTTMRDKHVDVRGARICFEFCGKSGKDHEIDLADRRLARIVARCQDLPGQELFQFINEQGEVCDVGSSDVNDYLREISQEDFTAKDFRTWSGTVLAARALQEFTDFDSQAAAKRNVVRAIEHVAERLGNTKAVCRKCYVHPAVIEAYLEKSLLEDVKKQAERELRDKLKSLPSEEAAVLALLHKRTERDLQDVNSRRGKKRTKVTSRKAS